MSRTASRLLLFRRHCPGTGQHWLPVKSPLLTNTTRTAAYLETTVSTIETRSGAPSYAAVAAKISARFALVIMPTLNANTMVNVHIIPSFAPQDVT
ncbi:uncharacterized protein ColSpa_01980 [Colletotrichum spaethianum]|uniref:Uncharacterized protein n=1 Tax=Colletotrichum spaethianum TaxID=700344 RepID=A0AA37L707_9PEZI|nr:uncharacterized protein ColSpa_01980 [Colletotrichum spaethianum]GKT41799.1 hypothetical protein ColSpa_01980 [Colletotrichum spaethianum]